MNENNSNTDTSFVVPEDNWKLRTRTALNSAIAIPEKEKEEWFNMSHAGETAINDETKWLSLVRAFSTMKKCNMLVAIHSLKVLALENEDSLLFKTILDVAGFTHHPSYR